MDALIALVVLAALGLPLAVVWLLVTVARLRGRLARLETELGLLRGTVAEARAGLGVLRGAAARPETAGPDGRTGLAEAAPGRPAEPPPLPAVEPPPLPTGADGPAPAAPSGPEIPSWAARLGLWTRRNVIYVAAAASLGLAGVFLVQYGAEAGLLTPPVRIGLAILLGLLLLGAGEALRRRFGDLTGPTAALPSTLSAAGLVALYAAILGARGLYGLIGPGPAVLGLAGTGALAVALGWVYGPFLAAAGLLGAAAAPFLVGGEAGTAGLLFAYYGLLATVGLAIDAVRRWGWVSVVTLAPSFLAAAAVQTALPAYGAYAALMLWLAVASVAVPRLELRPTHPGLTVLEAWLRRAERDAFRRGPIAPTWIAAGGVGAATAFLWLFATPEPAGGQLVAALALTALALALILWAERAEGLSDLALVPTALLLALVPWAAALDLPVRRAFATTGPLADAAPISWAASLLLLCATLLGAAAWWRSRIGRGPRLWGAAAAATPTAMAVALEIWWRPAEVIGAASWAFQLLAVAAALGGLAVLYARRDGEDRRRTAYAALGALALVALALGVLLSAAALTMALAALVAGAAVLDRRFRLPEMSWAVAAGVAGLGWRLVIDPGLWRYLRDAPGGEVGLAFGAAILGLGAARALLPPGRAAARAAAESGALAYGGVLASILVWRFSDSYAPQALGLTHWSASLLGLVWTILGAAQAWRARAGGRLAGLRWAVAALEGGLATMAYAVAIGPLNPLLNGAERVHGTYPFDTLLVAYLIPAAAFVVVAHRVARREAHLALLCVATLFAGVWGFLVIRRFWRGDVLAVPGFTQPELTSYTAAMLIVAAVLLGQALLTRSGVLRRLAMALMAAAVAKVFLVDAGGLTGLLRVMSFLGLGLMLAGLAWLDRWASARR